MRYLLVGLLLLAGCSPTQVPTDSPSAVAPSGVTTTPTPEPTPTCSPIGGTPSPCSPDEYAKVEAQNKLVNEAIAVYKRWNVERIRLYRAGGASSPTDEMRATTAGDFRSASLEIFKNLKRMGARAISGEIQIVTIGPDRGSSGPTASHVALETCVDGRSMQFQLRDKRFRNEALVAEKIIAKTVDGQLKLWSVSSGEVASC